MKYHISALLSKFDQLIPITLNDNQVNWYCVIGANVNPYYIHFISFPLKLITTL